MSDFELVRITHASDADPCDLLSREYMGWLVEQLRLRYDIALGDAQVEEIHRDMPSDGPKLLGDHGRLYLGKVEGDPVALGVMKPVSAAEGELKRRYVRPQWRGRGFGRRVFDQLVQDARSLGLQRLRLETFSFMEAAIGMYRASGFVETQPFDGFEGEKRGIGDIEVFMSLDLT